MFSIVVAVLFIPKDVLAQVVTEKEHYTLAESIQHSFVKKAWKYVLALLNGIVVLGLIIVALANILRLNIETYHIKRMLPSIIIGVILANFSYLICRVVIDLAQVVADFFISGVTGDDIVKIFGFNEWQMELSTRPEKTIGTDADWQRATSALEDSLKEKGVVFRYQ